jgi:2-polyprenyl-3-methyl-5-hydroxy-6-metoxy-1,4-benzoquinol methylase
MRLPSWQACARSRMREDPLDEFHGAVHGRCSEWASNESDGLTEAILVTRDDVISAYRLILGREPESEEAIKSHLGVASLYDLRGVMMDSDEFKVNEPNGNPVDFTEVSGDHVDVHVSDAHFDRLVKHVQETWERLGATRPHWSVITDPQFLPEQINANLEEFYSTAEENIRVLEKAAKRANKVLAPEMKCFELGCGVGRMTGSLAKRFKHVLAADISYPHLQLADEHLRSIGAKNVSLIQMKSLNTLAELEPVDLFYSVIALQHNPPPLIFAMLQMIFGKIRRGGFVNFQVTVALPGYRFVVDEYLSRIEKRDNEMEMHVLPQVHLFDLLDKSGFRILDAQQDRWAGPKYQSMAIFAEKIRKPEPVKKKRFRLPIGGSALFSGVSKGILESFRLV